ncbi:LamG domain-containing protein [Lysinibacillus sp. NPDC093692]|uniref:LamG domain-containing protein n=1 Tax=Lysinibacillus sp. NPDC093692 TaxID=3390578 RepID=UPI003D022A0A
MATTEQLMEHYGVAWFGFDEASGNVVDKLGNGYTGTVTGATRVSGWNDEGHAMDFNGSNQYITTNFKPPTGELTVRFKIKVRGDFSQQYNVFSTQGWTTTGNGIDIAIRGTDPINNGKVVVRVNNTSNPVFSDKKLETDRWYDIMVSVNFSKQVCHIYINDSISSIGFLDQLVTSHTNNLVIGRTSINNANQYLNGQLDDLQIYNKALSPSDFTQKRLLVKTTDNKNLVLSPNTTRVKEIPNTAEYMMLAQGGVIKEIDSSVKTPPIDFTKTTTEYEIVTNNKTPLGKGRMFTIPISNDFKTAMIEDNY